MKDDPKGNLVAMCFSGQGDVVDVWSRLKVTGGGGGRFEGPVRAIALEYYDGGGYRRGEVHSREEVDKYLAKLLESRGYLLYFFLTSVANQEKVFRAHADPRIFSQYRCLWAKNGEQEKDQDDGDEKTFHLFDCFGL